MAEKAIHIYWQGPFSHEEAVEKFNDEDTDYGVYQIYGTHQVYGFDTLLYIGMAGEQTLSTRLSQHEYRFDEFSFPRAKQVHVGRLTGGYSVETPTRRVWAKEIEQAERLLILSHCPTQNSQGLNIVTLKDHEEFDIRVFNWGRHGLLLPEVSGHRYSYASADDDHEAFKKCYSCKAAGKSQSPIEPPKP